LGDCNCLDDEEDKRLKRAENYIRASRKSKAESAGKAKGRGGGKGCSGKGGSNNELNSNVLLICINIFLSLKNVVENEIIFVLKMCSIASDVLDLLFQLNI
jgi:hypothetical protein